MREYVKMVKGSAFKSVADEKNSNINKGRPCKDVAGGFFDDVRIQRKLEEPLQLQAVVYSQGDFKLKNESFPQYRMKSLIQLMPFADDSSGVVQFTVGGIRKNDWLTRHGLKGKKRELFADFFDMVHMQSDYIFFEDELNSYYERYEKENYAMINQDDLKNFDLFKKYVAMIRDPEGAHGAQKHTHASQVGNQYIVDRVLAPRGPKEASYLPIDTYLQWDNKLIMNHEAIFKKYIKLVRDLIFDVLPIIDAPPRDIETAKAIMRDSKRKEDISISDLEKLTLSVFFDEQSFARQANGFRVKMKASIKSNQQVGSVSVRKEDANELGIHGIRVKMKEPEAHTGSLSPEFKVEDGNVDGALVTSNLLKWVTKF